MKTSFKYMVCLVSGIFILSGNFSYAQLAKVSFNKAYNMLNTGSQGGSEKTASVVSVGSKGSALSTALGADYSHKVKVGYGIPIEIVFEYVNVKVNLSSDMASDPETYNNSAGNVQQAFVNLAYGDFQKISDYNKVDVKLNYRYNPARLVIYGSDEYDFVNNTRASPWDVAVYKTPSTPVSGTKILVIKK